MAKKQNAKERRAQQELNNKKKWQNEAEKKRLAEEEEKKRLLREEEERKRREAEKREREEAARFAAENPALFRAKKSRAKAAGLKSTFVIGDELLMTSFGKGNEAVAEHHIRDREITSLNTPSAFQVENGGASFAIKGKNALTAVADDPRRAAEKKGVREDMIGAKTKLEERFFGKSFDDNVHIQLIYSILDIEKILSKHINNIVYSIDNVRAMDGAEYDDFMGYMGLKNSYGTFCNPSTLYGKARTNVLSQGEKLKALLKNPRLGYFGSAFYRTGNDLKAKKRGDKLRDGKDIYYMLAMLGETRQALAHSSNSTRDFMYTIDRVKQDPAESETIVRESTAVLNTLYAERVNALNENFIAHSKKDLTILFSVLGIKDRAEKAKTAATFYDFVVRKSFKNIGFSIKKLRERMMDFFFAETGITADDPNFSSVRQKFYRLLDFCIYRHYLSDGARIERNVSALRTSLDAWEKEKFYITESERLWQEMKAIAVGGIYPQTKGKAIAEMKDHEDADLSSDMIAEVMIGVGKTSWFSKLIYMLTLFIDGKEINDLLTTMIHQFENIDAFLCIMRERGMAVSFVRSYEMFLSAGRIAAELREINSFARMEKPHPAAKKQMYLDAATVLGCRESEQELAEYFETVLDQNQGKLNANGKKDNSFRNFLARNVIESDRFIYLIRYNNPKNVRAMAQNLPAVTFVLRDLPDTQIARYCKICGIALRGGREECIRALAEMIRTMDFKRFASVRQKAVACTRDGEEKQRMQATVGLYLTVLYLLTKNLVYVNSRYFLAFHCLERDGQLLDCSAGYKTTPYNALTRRFVEEGRLNRHAASYLTVNLRQSDQWSARQFRNAVAHLNAIRNAHLYIGGVNKICSYFELYHYLIQRALLSKSAKDAKNGYCDPNGVVTKPSEKTLTSLALAEERGWYCKDLVKNYCIAFGYNLARYKNLTIDDLFDKDRPREDAEEGKYRCRNLAD